MLTTFGNGTMSLTGRRVLLGVSGGIISVFIIVMAIYMILQANKKIKLLKSKEKQNEKKETFNYTYSAKEQEEIKAIRNKYTAPKKTEDKMAQLRRLDSGVNSKATAASLVVGIIGALIIGTGMSIIMTEIGAMLGTALSYGLGIGLGVIGIILVCLAYPVYNYIIKKERARIAPEIIRLTDELIK